MSAVEDTEGSFTRIMLSVAQNTIFRPSITHDSKSLHLFGGLARAASILYSGMPDNCSVVERQVWKLGSVFLFSISNLNIGLEAHSHPTVAPRDKET